MFKRHERTVRAHKGTNRIITNFECARPDPGNLAGYAFMPKVWSYPSDTDDRIESPPPDFPHAVTIAEYTRFMIGIAAVRPLIDQCWHLSFTITPEWRPARCDAISSAPLCLQCFHRTLAP